MAQLNAQGQPYEDDAPEPEAPAPAAAAASTDALDDLLAEIDGSLQVNAEQFVRSFVQKGGQ
ncbi:ubiquitin-like protein Pup [Demequina sp. SYSU T00192]|uniref:Prokaryotic ubiquitin-like protein Pup n=1 Tax=Demequina litoralis TaxID=3051660 RepID=A0ABT8G539_9MICO|nr:MULTISPECIES: ubiquitin-like protein Pup [Demequina]MDN4474253.1 ubiquitin-like protein Pup [Demequina sp. SYSU T00192]